MVDSDLPSGDDDLEGGRAKVAYLQSVDVGDDLEAFAAPVYWPSIPSVDFPAEMDGLRRWVEQLIERFEHLDATVIPACWWRHNGHVEALSALRDHERVSYSESSPGKDGADWHRAFVLIEARLREWTGWLGCASGHREPIRTVKVVDGDEWQGYLQAEKSRRQKREVGESV